MFADCGFCSSPLGGDGGESGFGVGKRFAFDSWQSRAWVICSSCGRWNLTPFDTRIEAIAALERMASAGRAAASSQQVTLFRVGAYDVVRIGKPPRVEMATWRYGERLKARRRENMKIYVPVAVATIGIGVALNAVAGGAMGAMMGNLPSMIDSSSRWFIGRRRVLVEPPVCERCGTVMHLRSRHMEFARLTRKTGADLALLISCPKCRTEGAMLTDSEAERALRTGMTWVNLKKRKAIKSKAQAAAEYLERHGGPDSFMDSSMKLERQLGQFVGAEALALEMAVDEQAELHELERQWRQAEELARIADSLLIDPAVEARLNAARNPPPD